MKYAIPAVVFAGGKSSRMGKDKALLPFLKYSTLSQYQYQRLEQFFEKVYLSAKTDKFSFPANTIIDQYEQSSPLVALISILEQLDAEAVFILSVDAPLVGKEIIKKLWDAYRVDKNTNAVIAKSPSGLQPLCGIYKKEILPYAKINLEKNKHSLMFLLNDQASKTIFFEDDKAFTNVNTQEEYLNLLNNFN